MPAITPVARHCVRAKRRRWLAAFFISLIAWELLAWGAARFLVAPADLPRADALVVLSGAADHVERAHWAAELWHQGRAARVLVTNDGTRAGWSESQQRNPYFFERSVEQLQRFGVPFEKIEVLRETVSSTYEEAMHLRQFAEANGLRSILVVTSAYHSRRALWTMRRVLDGSNIGVGLSPAPTGGETPAPSIWWFTVRGWKTVPVEYFKLVYYWMHYR